MTEYQREFTRLSKYAPEMLVTEEEEFHKFEDGLNDYIQAYAIGFGHDDYSKIVTCALNVERVKKEEYDRKKRRQGKKNSGQSSSYQHHNKKYKGPQGSSQPTLQRPTQTTGSKTILPTPSVANALGDSSSRPAPPYCTHRGRRNKGDCWRLTSSCLVCGSNEHKVKDCPRVRSLTAPQTRGIASSVQKGSNDNKSVASPNAPRTVTQPIGKQDSYAPARGYAMKAIEDKYAPDVIVGNFNIFDTIVHALIDLGSTHSYVCTSIPSLGSLLKSETEHDILVTNLISHSVVVNGVYRDYPIRIREYEFLGDLIELSFREFDVILGMNWLSRHQVVVDCRMKRVTLRTPSGEEVSFIGEISNHHSNVVSITTARTMV